MLTSVVFANSEMGPLRSFHKFPEGVHSLALKQLDQKSAVTPRSSCGCSPQRIAAALPLNNPHEPHASVDIFEIWRMVQTEEAQM
jgi:hypothetical protein